MKKVSPHNREPESRINLAEYWWLFWRKKHLVLVPVLAALVVAMVGVRFLVPVYRSSAVIRIEDRNFLSGEVGRFVRLQEQRKVYDREMLARMQAELKSSSFLDQFIKRLGLDKNAQLVEKAKAERERGTTDLPLEELVLRRLRGHIRKAVKVSKAGPAMFRISCFDFRPDGAYLLTREITELYIENQQKKQIKGIQAASDFSDEQLAVYKERLEKSERELERFKKSMSRKALRSNPVSEGNLRYAETLAKQVAIAVDDKENTVGKIRANLVALFGAVPSSEKVWRDSEFEKLENKLVAQTETELLLELAGKGENTDDLRSNTRAIEKTQGELQRRLALLVSRSYPAVEADYHPLIVEYFYQMTERERLAEKQKRLSSYLESFRRNVELKPQMERELAKLKEQVETNRSLYKSFLKAKTASQITEAAQSTNLGITVEVVEKAAKPLKPVKPNKPKIIVLALAFAVVLGLGGIFLTEYTDTSFRKVEEIEDALGLKILGTVPRFEPASVWEGGGKLKRVVAWSAATVFLIACSLLGFYYYGKSVENRRLDVYTQRY